MGSWRASHKRAQLTQVVAAGQAGAVWTIGQWLRRAIGRRGGSTVEGMTPFVIDIIDKDESGSMLQRLATALGGTLLQDTSAHG